MVRRGGEAVAVDPGFHRRGGRLSPPRPRLRSRATRPRRAGARARLLGARRHYRVVRGRLGRCCLAAIHRLELGRTHPGAAASSGADRFAVAARHGAVGAFRARQSRSPQPAHGVDGGSRLRCRHGGTDGDAHALAALSRRRCGDHRGVVAVLYRDLRRRARRLCANPRHRGLSVGGRCRTLCHPPADDGERHRQFHSTGDPVLHPRRTDHGARRDQRAAGPLHPCAGRPLARRAPPGHRRQHVCRFRTIGLEAC
jgi:hypothetical protein